MLKIPNLKTVVLIGSTSDLGLALINALPISSDTEVLFVGTSKPVDLPKNLNDCKTTFLKCDVQSTTDLDSLSEYLQKLETIDFAVVAAGYLPLEHKELDLDSVRRAFLVNSLGAVSVISILSQYMSQKGYGRIILISSVATIRPRIRNFTYGASKSAADFFAQGMQSRFKKTGVRVTIVRPGYIHTKLTRNFTPAPFATTIETFCDIVLRGIAKDKKIIYVPRKLRIVMNVFKFLPKGISDVLAR